MSHWEDAVHAGADALPVTNHTSFADSRDVLAAADEHLHDHYLERIIKGQDDQADEALLDHYRLIVLREELERAERVFGELPVGRKKQRACDLVTHLSARVAELEGQKQ
ncbi:hypothetical protein [Arthrobacter woluwensis]|uniref:Uncharacterized protein n=1 Tax=Arthrobacter woluwensis TaxID=156980 RepID=A0A1H4WTY7_9MICC|nr:hypothetical protein [Arthrobacter woluwensis]SEC89572.1 hypothetical protein SAMN04489745_3449 [Arthrobacter woluwensis]SEC96014.1 hypothetical protein SAMN04489745_3555 [Arthrobacter woluwensis]